MVGLVLSDSGPGISRTSRIEPRLTLKDSALHHGRDTSQAVYREGGDLGEGSRATEHRGRVIRIFRYFVNRRRKETQRLAIYLIQHNRQDRYLGAISIPHHKRKGARLFNIYIDCGIRKGTLALIINSIRP